MMDKDQLIANYLSNSLSETERHKVNQLLETDVNFKEDFEFQKRVRHTIFKKEHDRLKKHFVGLESELRESKNAPSKRIWYLAASILIMVALSFLLNTPKSSSTLYAEFYSPPKNIVHPIVRSNGSSGLRNEAFIAYASQDYGKAHQLFTELYNPQSASELLFYDAIALMELDSTTLAIETLRKHQNFNDAVSAKTNWYLALAHLKAEQFEACKSILTKIIADHSYNHQEAKKLLSDLD